MVSAEQRSPFGPAPLQSLRPYYGLLRPCASHRYSDPRGLSRLRSLPLHRGTGSAQAGMATDVVVQSEDAGFNRKRHRADGGSSRWLHFEGRPAFLAKSRYELPAKLPCPKDFDVSVKLAAMFPSDCVGTETRSKTKVDHS